MKREKREQVYNKYNGRCGYCGKPIEYKEMQVDHMIPKSMEMALEDINCMENLMPSCGRCNHYKRSMTVEHYRAYIKDLARRVAKDYIVKVALDYGIVALKDFDGKFYFEKFGDGEALKRLNGMATPQYKAYKRSINHYLTMHDMPEDPEEWNKNKGGK